MRDPEGLISAIIGWLEAHGCHNTADLAKLMGDIGMRLAVEGFGPGRWSIHLGAEEDSIRVTGKGGCELPLRIRDPAARLLLRDPARCTAIAGISAHRHRANWRAAALACGVASETPQDVRRTVFRKGSATPPAPSRLALKDTRPAAPPVTSREPNAVVEPDTVAMAGMLGASGRSETARWLLGEETA